MAAAGFTNPATTDSEVIGTNGQIAATVACQALSPQQFQATVMVAVAETVAPAVVSTTLDTLTSGLTSGGGRHQSTSFSHWSAGDGGRRL